jgi:hypothetical protein
MIGFYGKGEDSILCMKSGDLKERRRGVER